LLAVPQPLSPAEIQVLLRKAFGAQGTSRLAHGHQVRSDEVGSINVHADDDEIAAIPELRGVQTFVDIIYVVVAEVSRGTRRRRSAVAEGESVIVACEEAQHRIIEAPCRGIPYDLRLVSTDRRGMASELLQRARPDEGAR